MKQILLIFGPVVLLGILLTGGFSLKDPGAFKTLNTYVAQLIEEPQGANKTLQIKALKAVTPTPTPTGAITPTPNPTPVSSVTPTPAGPCERRNVAIDLLIDMSGSMILGNKLPKLREALQEIQNFLTNQNLLGMQVFSDYRFFTTPGRPRFGATEVLPFGNYNQNNFQNIVSALDVQDLLPNTHMRDGFLLANEKIQLAQAQFPGYNWHLILITDGVPNDVATATIYDASQDPTSVIPELRALNVKIFVIGLDLNALGADLANRATSILVGLVENPDDFKASPSSEQLREKFRDILGDICGTS